MRMETSLQQRPELRLKLAPQIIQSIEILQLATLDLKSLIEREMEMNPTIEIENAEPAANDNAPAAPVGIAMGEMAETPTITAPPTGEGDSSDRALEAEFDRLDSLNESWKEFSGSFRPSMTGDGKDKKLEAMQNTADRADSLQKHLENQFAVLELSQRENDIGDYLIYNIDDNGFLRFQLNDDFLKGLVIDPPVTVPEAESVLSKIQALEPAGVGARDLRECLLLQLEREFDGYPLEKQIVRDHLDDVVANRLPKIAKATGVSLEEVDEAIKNIKMICNPKPGRMFTSAQVQYVIPDVLVEEVDGKWEVRLEDTYIPRIHISRHYQEMLRAQKDDPKIRAYIKKKIESAKWLIESIEQRQNTLFKIAREIVDYQTPFLEHGIDALRPLKMQFIADKVGVHVSTVSRAIADKYMQTPRGVFALKYFFTGGTTRADGEEKSIIAVKQKVRDIVGKEDKTHPLSDEEIAAKLKEDGLDIARRTVTKYRKQLAIPSSRQRRSYIVKG
jgi:RNA polymerase sigma-54 factor